MRYLSGIFVVAIFVAALPAQDAFMAPGDNLVTEGIPKIPASLAAEVARYTEFRSAGFSDWHPTRREMLIGTRFADTAQVHQVTMPGGARRQLTFFADSAGGATYHPQHSGDFFVFAKGTGGNERYQNYRYEFATGNVTLLTDGKARNSRGIWSNAGDKMAYTSTRRNGADADIYVIDPAEPKSDRLAFEVKGGGWFPLDWGPPDDSKLLVGEYVSINESYLWEFDLKSKQRRRLTPKSADKVAYSAAKYDPDGKGLYVVTDKDSEFKRLAYLDPDAMKLRVLTEQIPWDVEEFELAHDGQSIAIVTNEDGIGVLRVIDVDSGKFRMLPKLPPGSVGGIKWHRNSKDLAFHLTSSTSPPDVYSLDLKSGKVERWTHSETGGINPESFPQPELVKWKSFDGRMISGFLYNPPRRFERPRPVIINIHGGPESQFRPTFLGRNNYYLNEMGVAILFPNIRGSDGYGKTFLTLDNGFKREDSYRDIEALLDWIAKRSKSPLAPMGRGVGGEGQPAQLDVNRIMVTGGSYGGHMTLAVATYYPERIRCAVDVVGMSNLVSFLENTESYRRDLRRAEYGDERDPKMRAFMEKIAPLTNAAKIKRPLFVIQGKNDPRVPLIEAEQMVATLKKHDTPVWYLMAKDEGHGFAKKRNADFQFYATVMFMREFLLDKGTK
jgi:dipeptidyl aminopeptidase/acylaminoacyl peptidase